MLESHDVRDQVVLRLVGRIEATTVADGEVRAYQVRLDTGDPLSLTPRQLTAAVDAERTRDLLLNHLLTGEPLGSHEVAAIEAAGLAARSDFDMTGGDLYCHVLRQDEEDQ